MRISTESEKLVHVLNGKKYLLVEIPIMKGTKDRVYAAVEKHEGVYQGVKKIHQSFWGVSYAINKFLIPEENIMAFSKEGV